MLKFFVFAPAVLMKWILPKELAPNISAFVLCNLLVSMIAALLLSMLFQKWKSRRHYVQNGVIHLLHKRIKEHTKLWIDGCNAWSGVC